MLLRDGTTPLGINDDSSSFVAAREREFNEINAAEPGVCDEPTHSGHDPQIATRDIYGYWIRIEARAILLLLLLFVFRAEYFRFRFWELDDDDDDVWRRSYRSANIGLERRMIVIGIIGFY